MTLDDLRRIFLVAREVEQPPAAIEVVEEKAEDFSDMFKASHRRPDGTKCNYMAEDFCNKCGWMKDTDVPAKDADLLDPFATDEYVKTAVDTWKAK